MRWSPSVWWRWEEGKSQTRAELWMHSPFAQEVEEECAACVLRPLKRFSVYCFCAWLHAGVVKPSVHDQVQQTHPFLSLFAMYVWDMMLRRPTICVAADFCNSSSLMWSSTPRYPFIPAQRHHRTNRGAFCLSVNLVQTLTEPQTEQ